MQRTKIICTIGPACSEPKVIREMVDAGMDVARLNLSHGNHELHKKYIDAVKSVREKVDTPLGILVDLKGPEFRIREFENGKVNLEKGANFTLTTAKILGNENIVSVTYKPLPELLQSGDKILLSDGLIELEVVSVNKFDILTKVVVGGELQNNKSLNLPEVKVEMPFISASDKEDIRFAIENDVDFIALSFVRTADDVKTVRKFINENGGKEKQIKLISKIENQHGVDNIDSIIEASDGIMIARGDLGVEVELRLIPIYQKYITERCLKAGKHVIVATQMLESMIENARPTRAELTDVANAVLDGASALMLSGETAVGKNVVKAVETMNNVIAECEENFDIKPYARVLSKPTHSQSIAFACKALSETIGASAILVTSQSGDTALDVAGFRPKTDIIVCTPNEKTYNQMSLCWGIKPLHIAEFDDVEDLLKKAKQLALKNKFVQKDDVVIETASLPLKKADETNFLKIDRI